MLSPFVQQYLYSGRQNNGQLHLRWLWESDAAERDGGSAPSMSLTVNPANNRVTSFGFYDADARTVKQNNPRCFYNRSNQRAWKITGSIEEFSLLSAATGAAGEFHSERHHGLPRSAHVPATAPLPGDPAAG